MAINDDLSNKITHLSLIAIIMVVFIHSRNVPQIQQIHGENDHVITWFAESFIADGICRVAVPLFFMFSGFLFFQRFALDARSIYTKYKSRFHSLLIPYLIWSVCSFLVYYIMQSVPWFLSFFTKDLVTQYSFKQIAFTILVDPVAYQFWFIRDLMLIVLFSPLLYLLIKHAGVAVLVLVFLLWFIHVDMVIISPQSLLFFIAGSYFAIKKTEKSINLSRYRYLFLIAWLVLLLAKTALQLNTSLENDVYVVYIKQLSILAGLVAVWILYDDTAIKIFKNKLFTAIAPFTFFIFAFHEPLLTIVKKGLLFFMGKSAPMLLLVYILAPVIVIFISFITGRLIKKRMSLTFKWITGGR